MVRRYSFGLRLEVWRRHREADGFRLLATDFPPSLPPPAERLSNDEEMRRVRPLHPPNISSTSPPYFPWEMRRVRLRLRSGRG